MFTGSFYDSVDGLEVGGPGVAFYDDEGKEPRHQGLPIVSRRLRRVDNPAVREAQFIKTNTAARFKVTFPAWSFFELPFVYRNGITEKVYNSHEELVAHMIALESEQIDEAIAAGLDYVQFDFPRTPCSSARPISTHSPRWARRSSNSCTAHRRRQEYCRAPP